MTVRISSAGIQRIGCLAMLGLTNVALLANDERTIQFNRDIRPVLADKCLACHGLDAKKRQADLRLDEEASALLDRDGQAAIVPGQPDQSSVWQRIVSQDPDLKMPPAASHKSLSQAEVELIRRWIEQGAAFERHWAFEMPKPFSIPEANDPKWIRNPIDAFLQSKLAEKRLEPSPEADKSQLIRRVAFALTGLPPTLEQLDRFLEDDSSDAYESMVDRFLESKHFGEEMARHWLDVARYADTHGMHLDNERQTWAYRDWVVQAFNRNMPFDQFTVEQLAGDLLPNPSQDQLIATGYNRCNVTSSEGGSIDAELLYRYAVDRTSTTIQTWMGLTGGCAVCHDHKFDPISQREFYSMYAFFNSAADPAMDGNAILTEPTIRLTSEETQKKIVEIDGQLSNLSSKMDELSKSVVYVDPAEQSPPPVPVESEAIWMDDEFPVGGALTAAGAPIQFADNSPELPVFSGSKAIKRTEPGLAQDVWESSTAPLSIPYEGKLIAHVWLDPKNLPKSIMVQFKRSGWEHRAVWGDYDAIPWGNINTPERFRMGDLPPAGQWTRLEVPIQSVGLEPGDLLTGFALTQFGGTVLWDKVGVIGKEDYANDPGRSFQAWRRFAAGKEDSNVPAELQAAIKAGPESASDEALLDRIRSYYLQNICQTTKSVFQESLEQKKQLMAQRQAVIDGQPGTFVYRDLPQPRTSYVMMRGAYDKPGEQVEPSVPAIFRPIAKKAESNLANRLDLARWLVDGQHPLTARVTVNRYWQQFFGIGLVKSSYDFGTQGEMPSHPELLDWLSIEYQESGWNTKALVRMIVTSHAFRQSSKATAEEIENDPENRWLGRGPRFRLDAEPIRDNALFVSGLIDLTMGGKGVRPYQPANIWEPVGFAGSNTRFYQQDSGSALYRRSLYTFYKRTAPPPFMSNFDAPNREQFCSRRERSNTPLQALQLMNDIQHVEASRVFAERILEQGGAGFVERMRFAYRSLLGREPESRELAVLERQLGQHRLRYAGDVEGAKRLIAIGQRPPNASCDPIELASYTLLANTLLNLDETLTRN